MKQGGMAGQFFAAYVGVEYMAKGQSAHRAMQMIDTIRFDIVAKHPADFTLALTADDILRARKQGKIAALIGIEGGHAIEDDLRLLRNYQALGARYMTLTHTRNLSWAGSSAEKDNRGLSEFGRQVIAEMNRLGIMVDIAHVSDKTFWDALEASQAPVFSSHSSCRAVSNIGRNMTDDMIRAVAKKGGVVMVNFGCEFLSQRSADTSPWINTSLPKDAKCARASIDDVVAHLDHIKKIAGAEAAGLGSDFDGVTCTPEGLDDVSKWPNLTRKLLEKGFTPSEIRKIYGGNILRVMRAAEETARRLR
ncbi:MAG: membrane dipeptidase, partial [Acidobacteria bacterium]|nr:membrane dipeptidase [Acidobacteriota bacterium]